MSFGLYVGSNHTADGVSYLAGYGDEPSSHWLDVVPRRDHMPESLLTIGSGPGADLPGALSEIPQVPETARHLRVSYSYFKGVPGPLTNGGLNEHGLAVRDVWSPSRSELVAMTPKTQIGPNYSDLARLVLERARTAREGVALIGDLIGAHGESTYGGNAHLIADEGEAWLIIQFAGGRGLWVAERMGPDSIRAVRPGTIGVVPVEEAGHPDFVHSENLVSFAVGQGWYSPDAGTPFDANRIYGDGKGRWPGVQWIEKELHARAQRPEGIMLSDVMWALRSPKLTGDTAGYGQVVPLTEPAFDDLRVLWHTQTAAIAAPFVPVYLGIETVPEEYRMHRYLTVGEASRVSEAVYIDLELGLPSEVPQGIESTRSATRVFKRLLYLVLQHPDPFLAEVTDVWEAVERRLVELHEATAGAARILLDAGEPELARRILTYVTGTELTNALNLADVLAEGLEARTRALFGINHDPDPPRTDRIW